MTDSRILELYKSGHPIRGLVLTIMFAFGLLFDLFIGSLVGVIIVVAVLFPTYLVSMELGCRAIWGN